MKDYKTFDPISQGKLMERARQIFTFAQANGGMKNMPQEVQKEWFAMPVLTRIDAIQTVKYLEEKMGVDEYA